MSDRVKTDRDHCPLCTLPADRCPGHAQSVVFAALRKRDELIAGLEAELDAARRFLKSACAPGRAFTIYEDDGTQVHICRRGVIASGATMEEADRAWDAKMEDGDA